MTKLSCGIVPVRKTKDRWEFLLLRCFKNWDFPKGMKEENESPLKAARREFTEETGLTDIEIISKDLFAETEPYNHGKVARYYLGIVTDNNVVKITPNPVTGILEHQEFRWVNFEEAETLVVARIKNILQWAQVELEKI